MPDLKYNPTQENNRFLLWIDGVGGFLLCLEARITMGRLNPEMPIDIALLADVSRHHASIQRDGDGYTLEAVRRVQINGQDRDHAFLRSGDRLTLGASCQLQFVQPSSVSSSARLDLVSGHRFVQPVQAVLLMAETLILGPGGHVDMPDLSHAMILHRSRAGLGIRWPGTMQIDGRSVQERGTLVPGMTVHTDSFSLALDEVKSSVGN